MKLEKQEIFAKIASMEERVGELYQEIGSLKDVIVKLLEENAQLLIENEHLRNRFQKRADQSTSKKQNAGQQKRAAASQKIVGNQKIVGEGYDNLARLYAEGFHICNVHYGSIRKEGDCLFCLSFLSGGHK